MEQHDYCKSETFFEIHAEWSQNCQRFCKTLSHQKHVVFQSTAQLQLKCFKVGSKMAIAASAPVLPNQKKKTVLHNCPIHWHTLYIWNFKLFVPCVFSTAPSSGEFTQLFTQPLVQWLYRSGRVLAAWTIQPLNQWLCEQLCEFSWGWACRTETCRNPSIYE
jgi:hypothetical protein